MNNFALKTCARQTIHESKPGIISTGALYILLNLLVSTVSDYWLGLNHMTDSEFLNYIGKGNYEYARIYLENHLNTAPQALIGSVLINLVCIIVSYGF